MVASVGSEELSSVVRKDYKLVTLLSTFAGQNPVESVERFDRKLKNIVLVNCPFIINEYNRHMGGIDLLGV